MIQREQKKSRWKTAVAAVVLALLACGLLISLAVRKNAEVEKIERRFAPSKTLAKPSETLPPLPQGDN